MDRLNIIKANNLTWKINIPLIFSYFNVFLFIFALSILSAFGQQSPINLILNDQKEYEIKGGERQIFSVNLSENQTARVEIIQNGIDVTLAAENIAGERFIETESPSGLLGDDLILVTAMQSGVYKIYVSPANPRSPIGKYKILLKEIRQTVAEDFQINEAAKKITKLAESTSVARAKGTIEGRREALAIWQEIIELSKVKKDRVWEGIALLSSGLIYEQLGEIQNALDVYTQSLEIWQDIKNRQYEGSAVNNLGIIYNDLGEYEKAISNYNQAIKIQTAIGNRPSIGIYLNNLAYAYMRLENYAEAEKFFRQSLEIKKEDESNRGQRSVAVTLNNLGTNLSLNGNLLNGIKYLQQSLDLRRKIEDKWGIANSLLNLGKIQAKNQQKIESRKNISEANIRSVELGDRRMEAESFYLLAILDKNDGDFDKAILNVSKGLEIVEAIRGELIGSEVRYAYFSTVQNYYELYIDLLISQFEKTKDKSHISKALELSERSRSRSLIELLQQANVNFKQGIDEKLLAKFQTSQSLLNDKYNARQRILSENPTAEQVAKINDEIKFLTIETENFRLELRKNNPKFADLTEGKTISATEIQNLLDEKTILLEYKLGENRSFLWLVSKNSVDVFVLPSRRQIEDKANIFYNLIVADKPSEKVLLAKNSNELSNILFGQIKTKIAGKRLAIVAEGTLQYLPFSALQSPNSAAKVLADENEIVILPSASVLEQIRENSAQAKQFNKTIAIFADPVFDGKDARIKRTNLPQTKQNQQLVRNPIFGQKLPRLIASRQEALNISSFATKEKINLRTDFDANIENVSDKNLADFRILHFATHGFLDTSKPAASGLVFSIFDENGREQNGFLNLDIIYNLNISSELVVLSACQTALGKDIRGEGLIGLSRGFLYAGSKRIVASLWKVDDSATAEFMKLFYRNHLEKNMSASAALRQAKLEMMKIPRYKSPFFWSAFTLLGDWR